MDTDERLSHPDFGDLLRRSRVAAGLTQESLAERAGLSRRGISDLERGARTHPYRETAKLLADALGLGGNERTAFLRAARRPAAQAAPRDSRMARLPVFFTPLIGRHGERATVRDLLRRDAVRLVTLTGPGGVGKTRLATAAAADLADAFPDGQVFVDLAPLRDPSLVLSGVASALGVREQGDRPLADGVRDALRGRRMVLVVDNFEHVLEAAPVVTDLLAVASEVKILATSRAPLRLRGEHEFPVPPLPLPFKDEASSLASLAANDAVAFFLDRAQAVRPDFALTGENATAIAEICARLDGLPLALELAAARVKSLPPAALLTRLAAPLPLLVRGASDAPERQRTLRDAIAWSHDLLAPREQVVFRRLGVFVGGWTLEAAEAVADRGEEIDIFAGLDALADQSLVRLDDSGFEPRYGMLETIREFAQERLVASGEEAALRRAHAAHYLAFAEQGKPHMYGVEQRAWLRRLEFEQPNFRAALETFEGVDDESRLTLAANLGLFWFLHAHFSEGRARLERALERPVEPTPHRAEALLGLGRIAACQGDLAASDYWLRQSEGLARALDAPGVLWQAIFQRSVTAEWGGEIDRVVPLLESALIVARQRNGAQATGVVLYALGDAAYQQGDLTNAEEYANEAAALLREAGDDWALGLSLTTVGAVALARADADTALASFSETLELGLGVEADWVVASALAGFAAVAAARGDRVAAARMLGATETLREVSRQPRLANHAHHVATIGAVRAALGDAAFAAAWEDGRALSVADAVTLPQTLGLLDARVALPGS